MNQAELRNRLERFSLQLQFRAFGGRSIEPDDERIYLPFVVR